MAITPITPLPPAPTRDDPVNFSARGDALMTALVAAVPQMNTSFGQVDTALSDAQTAAITAVTKADEAAASAVAAAAGAVAAKWVSGTHYPEGVSVFSPINYLTYRRKAAGAGTTDPSLDSANWAQPIALPGQTGANNAAMTTSVSLTAAQMGALSYAPAAHGLSVTLPDATTLFKSTASALIRNSSDIYGIGIRNKAGALLVVLGPGGCAHIGLSDNTTSAGVWAIEETEEQGGLVMGEWQSAAGLYTGIVSVLTPKSRDPSHTFGVVPMGGDLHILMLQGATSGQYFLQVANTASNVIGTPTLVISGGGTVYAATMIPVTATSGILVYSASAINAVKAIGFVINPVTLALTFGATRDIDLTQSAYSIFPIVLSGGGIAITYQFAGGIQTGVAALTLSGATVGSSTVQMFAGGGYFNDAPPVPISPTGFVVFGCSSGSSPIYAGAYTVAGAVLTISQNPTSLGNSGASNVSGTDYGTLTSGRLPVAICCDSGLLAILNITGAGTFTVGWTTGLYYQSRQPRLQQVDAGSVIVRTAHSSGMALLAASYTASSGAVLKLNNLTNNPRLSFQAYTDASTILHITTNDGNSTGMYFQKLRWDGANFSPAYRRLLPGVFQPMETVMTNAGTAIVCACAASTQNGAVVALSRNRAYEIPVHAFLSSNVRLSVNGNKCVVAGMSAVSGNTYIGILEVLQ